MRTPTVRQGPLVKRMTLGLAAHQAAMIAAVLSLMLGLAGCGGSDSEKTTTDKAMKAFCSAYTTLPDRASVRASIRAWSTGFAEIAPPDGMPDRVRTGMHLQSEASTGVAPSTSDEAVALNEFHAWATEHCGNPPITLKAR
mgnify:FL=1